MFVCFDTRGERKRKYEHTTFGDGGDGGDGDGNDTHAVAEGETGKMLHKHALAKQTHTLVYEHEKWCCGCTCMHADFPVV